MREFTLSIGRFKTTEDGEKYRDWLRNLKCSDREMLKAMPSDAAAVYLEELTLDRDVPFQFYVGDDGVGYIVV